MWLVIGGFLLYFGLSGAIWERINVVSLKDNPVTTILIRGAIVLTGAILVSSNIPVIFTSVSYPGWVVMGLLLLALAQTHIFWNQFKLLYMDKEETEVNDKDWFEIFYVTRFMVTLVAIVMLGVGVGNGVPGWHDIPDPYAAERSSVVVNK